MMPMPPSLPRTDNSRRRWLALHILGATILDGIEDDTMIIGVTLTTANKAGETVQHSAGMNDNKVRRHLIPPGIHGKLGDIVDQLVDLTDIDVPGSPGMLP